MGFNSVHSGRNEGEVALGEVLRGSRLSVCQEDVSPQDLQRGFTRALVVCQATSGLESNHCLTQVTFVTPVDGVPGAATLGGAGVFQFEGAQFCE